MKKIITLICFVAILVSYSNVSGALIGHWKFDGDATDEVVSGHDGIDVGDPTYVTGVDGQAVSFDGDDAIMLENSSGSSFADEFTAFTVTCWYKSEGTVDAFGTLVSKYGESGHGWLVRRDSNNRFAAFRLQGTADSNSLLGDAYILDGTWHHVACVYTGTERRLYVDGVLDGSMLDSGAVAEANAPVMIGAKHTEGSYIYRFIKGAIDDVRIYDTALDAGEVAALANAPKAINPLPADGEASAEKSTGLSWESDQSSFDVYLSANQSDLTPTTPDTAYKLGTFASPSVPASYIANLDEKTTYYWRVDEVGVSQGDIWEFTTSGAFGNPAPTLPVTEGLVLQLDSEHVKLGKDSSNNLYVYEWIDRSGNGNHANVPYYDVVAAYPSYDETGSFPALVFDGAMNFLMVSPSDDFDTENYMWFMVCRIASNQGGRLFSVGFDQGAEGGSHAMFGASTYTEDPNHYIYGWSRDEYGGYVNGPGHVLTGNWQIMDGGWDYGGYEMRTHIDGSNEKVSGEAKARAGQSHMEVEFCADASMDVAEFIMYKRCLSTAERQEVGGYLENKYGLTTSYPNVDPNGLTTVDQKWSYQLPEVVQYEDSDLNRDGTINFGDFLELSDKWMEVE